jgi:hypothetical protein
MTFIRIIKSVRYYSGIDGGIVITVQGIVPELLIQHLIIFYINFGFR